MRRDRRLPDQFGHIAQLPQILAGFGFTTASYCGAESDGNVNRNRFTWEALDGSSVLMVYSAERLFQRRATAARTVDALSRAPNGSPAREREFCRWHADPGDDRHRSREPDAAVFARMKEAAGRATFSTEVGRSTIT